MSSTALSSLGPSVLGSVEVSLTERSGIVVSAGEEDEDFVMTGEEDIGKARVTIDSIASDNWEELDGRNGVGGSDRTVCSNWVSLDILLIEGIPRIPSSAADHDHVVSVQSAFAIHSHLRRLPEELTLLLTPTILSRRSGTKDIIASHYLTQTLFPCPVRSLKPHSPVDHFVQV